VTERQAYPNLYPFWLFDRLSPEEKRGLELFWEEWWTRRGERDREARERSRDLESAAARALLTYFSDPSTVGE
jgi:hypothetical protein